MAEKKFEFHNTDSYALKGEYQEKGYKIINVLMDSEPKSHTEFMKFCIDQLHEHVLGNQGQKTREQQNLIADKDASISDFERQVSKLTEELQTANEAIQTANTEKGETTSKLESENTVIFTDDEYKEVGPYITNYKEASPETSKGTALMELVKGLRSILTRDGGTGMVKLKNGKKIKI